jgi:hypothetical protein
VFIYFKFTFKIIITIIIENYFIIFYLNYLLFNLILYRNQKTIIITTITINSFPIKMKPKNNN